MSRALYESLFRTPRAPAADPSEDLVRDLAEAGRLRRAAHDLATDEMLEGAWVEEQLDESEMRLAADDRSDVDRILTGGLYTVRIRWSPSGAYAAEQTAGPGGATLHVGEDWVPLDVGVAVDLPLRAMPTELILVDRNGKRIKLQ